MYRRGMSACFCWLMIWLLPGILSESCRFQLWNAGYFSLVVPQRASHLSPPPSGRKKALSFWNVLQKSCPFLFIGPGLIWNSNSAGCHEFYLVHLSYVFLKSLSFSVSLWPHYKSSRSECTRPLKFWGMNFIGVWRMGLGEDSLRLVISRYFRYGFLDLFSVLSFIDYST